MPGPGGVPGPGGEGAWSQRRVCSRGGAWSRGVCSGGVPGEDPPETATATGGTHPTGMHSCFNFGLVRYFLRYFVFSRAHEKQLFLFKAK